MTPRKIALLALVPSLACVDAPVSGEQPPPKIHTPRWAFSPWISKDISSGPDTRAFIEGFESRGIPVGTVVLDSPWETHYNSFTPNETRYPAFPQMVKELRQKQIRTVLWITQMVNDTGLDLEPGGDTYQGPSPNFEEGRDNGYFVNGGRTYLWWKGTGAGLDFFNPAAVAWWHKQQDPLLEMGIAGWKLDFGEEYLEGDTVETAAGTKTKQEYSEAYYRDFWEYGARKLGTEEFVTMVRPYDQSYGFPGRTYARPEHAPICWVGDNRRDWKGLSDALDHIFRSARAGYVVVGSDIGGYLDRDDVAIGATIGFDTGVFLRWTALGALTPFMQLHGRANITPWTVPNRVDETVESWRFWARLHEELVPFFYALAERAYAGGANLLQPIGDEASWAGDYRFTIGDAFLVAPILDATGVRDVQLPAGAKWLDFWRPDDEAIDGGITLKAFDVGRVDRIPLFLREGAIVPMKSSLLVFPGGVQTTFALVEENGRTTNLMLDGASLVVQGGGLPKIVEVRGGFSSASVAGTALPTVTSRDELEASASGQLREGTRLFLKLAPPTQTLVVTLLR